MKKPINFSLLPLLLFIWSCNNDNLDEKQTKATVTDHVPAKGTYAYDANFFKKNATGIIELQNEEGNAKVLLSAGYQGRVMTSTSSGDTGTSYGWINYDLIASGEKKKQFNPVGGEERFWMGPEGGQYSIFFKPNDSFSIAHWQVPPVIDTVAFDIKESGSTRAVFTKNTSFSNYSGTRFDIAIERSISLLGKKTVEEKLMLPLPSSVRMVAYETLNSIKNTGATDWKKKNGLLSIWLLGMLTPSPTTTVIIPFHPQDNARSLITDNYFGKIPPERLMVKDSVLYFTCDGRYRSKIGIAPAIAKLVAASYDFTHDVLNIVLLQVDRNGMYVNSKWEMQREPYKGDVVNSYNDGPLQDGSQLGPFYEIESSSPARELKRGEKQEYRQITCHLQGNYTDLKEIARKLVGVDLDEIKK